MGGDLPSGAADADLMLRVRDGHDRDAFRQLFERYERPLLVFLCRLCRDAAWAEDLCQGAFLRLWQGRSRYQPQGRFSTYLFQIAKNHFLNESDKRRRRRRDTVSLDAAGPAGDASRVPVAPDPAPDAAPRARELQDALDRALEALDEKHRLVFVLARYEGRKYREIAALLEIPEGTVKSRMNHVLRHLQAALAAFLPPGGGGSAEG